MIIVLIFLFIRNDRSVIPVHIQVCDIRISFLILLIFAATYLKLSKFGNEEE